VEPGFLLLMLTAVALRRIGAAVARHFIASCVCIARFDGSTCAGTGPHTEVYVDDVDLGAFGRVRRRPWP